MGLFNKKDKGKVKIIEEPEDDFPEEDEESEEPIEDDVDEIEEEDRQIRKKIKKIKSGGSKEVLDTSEEQPELSEKEMRAWMQGVEVRLQGIEKHALFIGVRD